MAKARNLNQSILRKSFSKNIDFEDIPHLMFLQKESYEKFYTKVPNIVPYKDYGNQKMRDTCVSRRSSRVFSHFSD